jgi:dolichyl-phosphate-mannose-protein mannosyltransferase
MKQPAASDAPARNSRSTALVLACLCACVAGGLWLRVHDLWRPPFYAFDEHHFVDNARVYLQASQLQASELAGLADSNDHPPLGKLWIALGMQLFGDSGLGWRILPAAFGAASVLWAALLARRLFAGSAAGCFALVFVSLDGFAIAYSRVALLDGMLTSLLLLCFWLLLGTSSASLAAAAVVGGLALSIKFSGVCYLGPLAGALLLRSGSGRLRWLLIAPALSLLVYYACYALGLWLLGAPWGPASVWQHTLELLRHHAGLIDMQNPSTSSWPTWFIPTRPLLLWRMVEGTSLRLVTSRGNPLLWWFCSASVLCLTGTLLWRGLGPVLREARFRLGAIELPARSLVFSLLCYWSLMAPWILTRRDSYLYHYLPAYLVAVVLVSGLFGALYQRRRRWALLLALAVVLVSAGYAPRWAGLPLRAAHATSN